MQSKRSKSLLLIVIMVIAGVFIAAMLHEPTLVQTPVEQVLDAESFNR
ncbi:MAG: hypothetical protein SFX19_07265 [Alphaproteobacteria bacterium]|nr:hypothetical protein [Alphaproteobacteria bacterium]